MNKAQEMNLLAQKYKRDIVQDVFDNIILRIENAIKDTTLPESRLCKIFYQFETKYVRYFDALLTRLKEEGFRVNDFNYSLEIS